MISRNDQLLGKASFGDSVVFITSEFDRGLTDPPNILCKVIDTNVHYYCFFKENTHLLFHILIKLYFHKVSGVIFSK